MGLINEAEIEASPSRYVQIIHVYLYLNFSIKTWCYRRKVGTRSSAMNDILSVDTDLMNALTRCLAVEDEEMYILLGKFLISFISTPNQFESFEIDNFVLKNSQFLTDWYGYMVYYVLDCLLTLLLSAWTLFNITSTELTAMRTSLLLKVAVIDIQPFETLLEDLYSSRLWEIRYICPLFSFAMLLMHLLDSEPPPTCSKLSWISHILLLL